MLAGQLTQSYTKTLTKITLMHDMRGMFNGLTKFSGSHHLKRIFYKDTHTCIDMIIIQVSLKIYPHIFLH